ncbi:MAG: type II toxin-antitoxin system death-on-curing family toxin [Chitinophagaceae bacterium]|nr:type II toxin-antitoxin system death-on-curing family toxin [Chitinophagaceae bacterium]
MITKEIILRLHELSIIEYGGSHGLRAEGSLESAIARPYQTFGGEDLYPTVYEKAAAMGESVIMNHPFVDGNKRTGFLAMLAVLEEGGLKLISSKEKTYQTVIDISTGSKTTEEIVEWLKANCKPI